MPHIETSALSSRSRPVSRAIKLEYFTVAWNVLEALVALAFATFTDIPLRKVLTSKSPRRVMVHQSARKAHF